MLDPECNLTAHHSLIENAAQSYLYPNWLLPDGNVVYDDSNLGADAVPTFVGNGFHQYMPISSSAVIDAGSLDYPEGVSVPLTDLAGNPRIYGAGTEFDFTYIQNDATVTFIPNCNQTINDIHWDFDMDGNIDSEELMPTYSYTANGNYSVGCYINNGIGGITKTNIIVITTGTDDQTQASVLMSLANYPNPFNPATTICFNIPKFSQVNLSVYNIKGQIVKQLADENMQQGQHKVVWDGRDEYRKAVSSGVYFVRLEAGHQTITGKVMLLK
jgi:PKD repeat protein